MVKQGIKYIYLMFTIKYVGWMERNIIYKYEFSTLTMKDDVD